MLILWLCLWLSGHYLALQAVIGASPDPKINKNGAAGQRKHVTLILQKLQIIKDAWKWQKLYCGYGFIKHMIINWLWYKDTEGPTAIVCGIKWKCEELFEELGTERSEINAIGQGIV